MIGLKATLNVIDNSGAQIVECIQVLKVGNDMQDVSRFCRLHHRRDHMHVSVMK